MTVHYVTSSYITFHYITWLCLLCFIAFPLPLLSGMRILFYIVLVALLQPASIFGQDLKKCLEEEKIAAQQGVAQCMENAIGNWKDERKISSLGEDENIFRRSLCQALFKESSDRSNRPKLN